MPSFKHNSDHSDVIVTVLGVIFFVLFAGPFFVHMWRMVL